MKKRVIAFVMCLVLVFSMLPAACLDSVAAAETEVEVELGENIALKATAYADYTNTGTNVKNVNNGILATGSATTWNTWKKRGRGISGSGLAGVGRRLHGIRNAHYLVGG